MPESSTRPQPDEARHASRDANDAVALAELPWSDRVVGLGFFPDEIGLGAEWTWSAQGLTP